MLRGARTKSLKYGIYGDGKKSEVLYNMRVCTLYFCSSFCTERSSYTGSITHLTFPTRSHLVSCSEDGTICIFRARDWVLLRQLRGHKGRVNNVAVHPTGKLALSVGKDRTLRMWDLMRGKASASVKLGKEGEIVRWSTKGDKFIVQSGSIIDIYSTVSLLAFLLEK